MKREQDSTPPNFVARLRRNIFGDVSPAKTETVEPANEPLPEKVRVNKVGKKLFELEVSDAAAIRPPLPESFIYPDAVEAAHLHAELLRELPPNHAACGRAARNLRRVSGQRRHAVSFSRQSATFRAGSSDVAGPHRNQRRASGDSV